MKSILLPEPEKIDENQAKKASKSKRKIKFTAIMQQSKGKEGSSTRQRSTKDQKQHVDAAAKGAGRLPLSKRIGKTEKQITTR